MTIPLNQNQASRKGNPELFGHCRITVLQQGRQEPTDVTERCISFDKLQGVAICFAEDEHGNRKGSPSNPTRERVIGKVELLPRDLEAEQAERDLQHQQGEILATQVSAVTLGVDNWAQACGLPAAETDHVRRQAIQCMAAGRVDIEDLRTMAEHLPGVVDVAAELMGISAGAAMEAAKQGVFTHVELLAALMSTPKPPPADGAPINGTPQGGKGGPAGDGGNDGQAAAPRTKQAKGKRKKKSAPPAE